MTMQTNVNVKPLTTTDRSARSIFVGNISYDVREEQVKQILSQAGQVVHFRLVHDRDTGRPKGFGFCEFSDIQSVDLAIRNINGYELNGRALRVDSATGGDRSADEVQQFQMALTGQIEESPYGPVPETGKAPEAIARTVASLPPEKMFELMKTMKETVNNNPMMARNLLTENPQLSYALLQAQVVMRVVDPKVAYSMLHRENPSNVPFHHQQTQQQQGQQPLSGPAVQQQQQPQQQQMFSHPPPSISSMIPGGGGGGMPPPGMPPGGFPVPGVGGPVMPGVGGPVPPPMFSQQQQQQRGGIGISPPMMGGPGGPMLGPMGILPPPQQQHMPLPLPTQNVQQQQQTQEQQDAADEEQQAQMLVKVLQLSDDQIRMLPPEDRIKVIELRNQLRQQVSG